MRLLNQEELRKLFHYDPDTGIFRWLDDRAGGKIKAGSRAGSKHKQGYRQISIHNCKYKEHRLAWTYMTGEDPGDLMIDHANMIRDDNRFENLRLADRQQQGWNRNKYGNNTSGFKGVSFIKRTNMWAAGARVDGKRIHLGHFYTPEDAAEAYQNFAKSTQGEFYRDG